MGKKLTTFEKLRRSFETIGVNLSSPDDNGILEFEYDNWSYLLSIFEEQEIFSLSEYVVGPDGNPPRQVFETALDVTKAFYHDVDGVWDERCSWISTQGYSLKGQRCIPKASLRQILKEFFEAHSFMEANIFLLMDETVWGKLPTVNN